MILQGVHQRVAARAVVRLPGPQGCVTACRMRAHMLGGGLLCAQVCEAILRADWGLYYYIVAPCRDAASGMVVHSLTEQALLWVEPTIR